MLYLHGGPGTGSYDFAEYQRDRLGAGFRLILVDQRGVLRSAALNERESLSPDDLIEDFEGVAVSLTLAERGFAEHRGDVEEVVRPSAP